MAETTKTTRTSTRGGGSSGFSDEEKAAMKERSKELKSAKGTRGKSDGRADLLAKVAEMSASDREMAERIDAIVAEVAPTLESRTWYGMPAYAKDGKVLCFFTPADKFKSRYATFGFNEDAALDEGTMWPASWALTKITKAEEQRLAELIKRAVG